jgi:hypothetical protein
MKIESTSGINTFYHASTERYEADSTIGPIPHEEMVHHVGRCLGDDHRAHAEQVLEDSRPAETIGRHRAIFLFGKAEHCLTYGDKEFGHINYYIYHVKVANTLSGMPMPLADRLYRYLQREHDAGVAELMAQEYWRPQRKWCFLEYLCESCVAVERTERVNAGINEVLSYIAHSCFAADLARCDRLHGRLQE